MACRAAERRDPVRDRGRYQHVLRAHHDIGAAAFRRDGVAFAVEDTPCGRDMRRLALRRFPTEVIRLRHGPPTRNIYGETVAGRLVRTIHPARVLPLSLEDSNFVGGVSLVERLKVYSPIGIQRELGARDTIRWGNGVLMWGAMAC